MVFPGFLCTDFKNNDYKTIIKILRGGLNIFYVVSKTVCGCFGFWTIRQGILRFWSLANYGKFRNWDCFFDIRSMATQSEWWLLEKHWEQSISTQSIFSKFNYLLSISAVFKLEWEHFLYHCRFPSCKSRQWRTGFAISRSAKERIKSAGRGRSKDFIVASIVSTAAWLA